MLASATEPGLQPLVNVSGLRFARTVMSGSRRGKHFAYLCLVPQNKPTGERTHVIIDVVARVHLFQFQRLVMHGLNSAK